MSPTKRIGTRGAGTAVPRFPQGKDAKSSRVQKSVTDDRLDAVRKLVADAANEGSDLRTHPSNRAVARALGCRLVTARQLLATVLAEHSITRQKEQR